MLYQTDICAWDSATYCKNYACRYEKYSAHTYYHLKFVDFARREGGREGIGTTYSLT